MKYLTSLFLMLVTVLGAQTVGPWDLDVLHRTPDWKTTTVNEVAGFTSILYESLDYLGNPVEVYAYYSVPAGNPPSGGWPAVVFAHGGGGTAFTEAVQAWNNQGYAAISMDLEGHFPSRELTSNPGPSRVGVWDDFRLPIEEQWYYHAVAQIILGHSLIASFPEVDANKIGVMGASWGGTLTSTVMGVDSSRWAWAAPVYGAGYLSETDGHQGIALGDGAETEFVNANYDGRAYFDRVTFPTLWLNGTNDFHFALTCNQQSSQAVNGKSTLRYSKGFAHGNLTWIGVPEVFAFANQVVNNEIAMPELDKPSIASGTATISFTADAGISSAELLYTTEDEIIWPDRIWTESAATISGNVISATLPSDAKAVFFTATDSRGYMTTSEYLIISDGNLALTGTAEQSSTSNSGDASKAIDANVDGAFSKGSVTHTENEINAYWQVTLDDTYNIGDIIVYGRTDDCCVERLSDFTVLVYDESSRNFFELVQESPNPSVTVNAGGASGNIIRIRSNTGQALSLAEVEVFEYTSINLALSGTARQSSTSFDGEASRAIDGNTNGMYSADSVTHTENESNAYWQVTLNGTYNIGNINVYGRTDDCCVERLSNFTVLVYDESLRNFFEVVPGSPNPSVTVNAGGVSGNIIRIRSNTGESLSLAEVEVFEATSSSAKSIVSVNGDQLELYPNPTTDYFQINSTDIKSVEVYNISGELVKEFDGFTELYLIGNLVPGVYIVKTISVDGRLNIDKLVKI